MWELSQIMDLQLNFEIVGTTRKYIKNHLPSDFYTKPPFCGHHQNLNPILT